VFVAAAFLARLQRETLRLNLGEISSFLCPIESHFRAHNNLKTGTAATHLHEREPVSFLVYAE
jgi:hypothetical protein